MKKTKGDGGERLYVRGRSGQIDMEQGTDSAWSKSQGRSSRLRNKDEVSGSGADGYDRADVMMVVSVEQLLDWIIDSGGSYHMTYKRDYLFDFEEYDGLVMVGNVVYGGQSGLSNVFWAKDTTMSTNLVNRSPSSMIGFKTPINMLRVLCWLACIKQGMLVPVGSQEYQVVCTRPDIASTGADMLDGFNHGLQTYVQVFVYFDYVMERSITVMGKSIIMYGLMIHGCVGSFKAMLHHMVALLTTEARCMTFTYAWKKEAIWLKGLFGESGSDIKLVVVFATGALIKVVPGSRFQH
ncbi:hypothetical protein Tco_0497006 [Tanacetum coccineum]